MSTPAEDMERLAEELQALARRLQGAEYGDSLFSREDMNRIVTDRLTRERAKRTKVEERVAELEKELGDLRARRED